MNQNQRNHSLDEGAAQEEGNDGSVMGAKKYMCHLPHTLVMSLGAAQVTQA